MILRLERLSDCGKLCISDSLQPPVAAQASDPLPFGASSLKMQQLELYHLFSKLIEHEQLLQQGIQRQSLVLQTWPEQFPCMTMCRVASSH